MATFLEKLLELTDKLGVEHPGAEGDENTEGDVNEGKIDPAGGDANKEVEGPAPEPKAKTPEEMAENPKEVLDETPVKSLPPGETPQSDEQKKQPEQEVVDRMGPDKSVDEAEKKYRDSRQPGLAGA